MDSTCYSVNLIFSFAVSPFFLDRMLDSTVDRMSVCFFRIVGVQCLGSSHEILIVNAQI